PARMDCSRWHEYARSPPAPGPGTELFVGGHHALSDWRQFCVVTAQATLRYMGSHAAPIGLQRSGSSNDAGDTTVGPGDVLESATGVHPSIIRERRCHRSTDQPERLP